MGKFKVIISLRTNRGIVYAPSLIEIAVKEIDAVKQAKERSRLSSFEEWNFWAEKIFI